MLIEQTLDKLNAMKLGGMADALQRQLQTDEAAALGFEERLGLLVDTEWTTREQRKLERRLHAAKLRYPATLEAVDFTHPRRLNRQQILTLGTCAWIAERHNLIARLPAAIGRARPPGHHRLSGPLRGADRPFVAALSPVRRRQHARRRPLCPRVGVAGHPGLVVKSTAAARQVLPASTGVPGVPSRTNPPSKRPPVHHAAIHGAVLFCGQFNGPAPPPSFSRRPYCPLCP